MTTTYYVITPSNAVRGPFLASDEAQCEIPNAYDTPSHDRAPDMEACCTKIRAALQPDHCNAEIEHCETWLKDDIDDDDEGYLIFRLTQEP